MASPLPKKPLQGHCSVIYNDTLYVYSPHSFQALPLKKGGKWTTLENGVSVSGAACVRQSGHHPSRSDALWVVGGASKDPKSNYPGLQKYTFATEKWQTIIPETKVTQHRQAHAGVYLPASAQLLIYAGSQDDPSTPSIETFLIGTSPPYGVQSATSDNAPVVWPQLLQWDDSSAVTVGGALVTGGTNMQFFLFNQTLGVWSLIKPSLLDPMKTSNLEQAALIQASDGSKVLQLYDLSVSPNNLTEIVLQDANGKAASPGQIPGQSSKRKRKRKLTLKDWPKYNAKNAPKTTRSNFAIATGSEGVVAITGGGVKSQPLELFNQETNSWVDSQSFFGIQNHHKQSPLRGGSSHKKNPQQHHQQHHPSPSGSPPATDPNSDHPQTTLILGASLGSILGFIALLIIFLLFMRWRRLKKRRVEDEALEREEKDRLSFADRGDPYMKEIGASGYHPHEPLPIDPVVDPKVGHRRSETRGSENSTTFLVPKKDGAYRMNDAMEMGPMREKSGLRIPTIVERDSKVNSLTVPGTQQKRTSGWSRYFSGADMLSIGAKNSARNSSKNSARNSTKNSARNSQAAKDARTSRKSGLSASSTRSSRDSYSNYEQSLHDCRTHGPTEIPPLDMGQNFNDDRISRVVTGNNVMGVTDGQARRSAERPRTVSSTFSTVPPSTISDTMFSQDNLDETTSWTPVTRSDGATPGGRQTAASSLYAPIPEGGEPPYQQPIYQQGPRISVPMGQTAKTVSGLSVVPRPLDQYIMEEDEDQYRVGKPSVATVVTVPAPQKAEYGVVQDDMGWIDLGARR